MQFGILGPLEVLGDDGRQLELGPRKQRAVLALLVVAAGRVVPLDRLVDELWAEGEPPAQATLSLQSYVARLRRILEPGRDPRQPSRLIVSRSPGWQLSLAAHTVDAQRFAELAETGRTRLGCGDPSAAATSLHAALAIWRGEALVEFTGLPTAAVEAVRLTELRATAVEDLMDAELALGNAPAVVAEATARLADHPYRERLWRALVVGLYRTGRQADALAAFARARTRLADDLGVDPGPELRAVEAAVLRQSAELDWQPPVATHAAAVTVEPPRPREWAADDRSGDASGSGLVGRDREVELLRSALGELRRGAGRVVLLSGPAGIGKTALVRWAERTAPADVTTALGTCIDADPPPAFWPWTSVLRALSESAGADELAAALGEHAQFLAVLDPVFGRSLGVSPPERLPVGELNRTRLMLGVADALEAVARRRPLMLVIDDAQWADTASVDLLAAVAARVPNAPLLVVVSYRSDETTGGSPFGVALPRLLAGSRAWPLEVSGLDRRGVAALLDELTGRADADVADALHDRTGGNPLFVAELTRMLASERALEPDRVRTEAAPPRVQQVLRRRLMRLPEQTNAVLTVAAAVGREVDVGVLGRVLGLTDDALQEALDLAIVSGLLDQPDEVGPAVRFSHDLVRQTLYDSLTGLRRARMHAEIARVLSEHPGTSAASLAHHFRLAAPVLDASVVVPRLAAAAAEAAESYAFEQSLSLFEQALQLSASMPAGGERDDMQLELHTRLGVLHQSLGGEAAPGVGTHFEQLVPLLRRVRIDSRVAPALICATTGFVARGRLDEVVDFADDVERRADPDDAAALAVIARYIRGLVRSQQGRHREARAELDAGLALARAAPVPPYAGFDGWDIELGMLQFAAISSTVLGEVDTAETHLRAARERAARVGTEFASMYVDHTEAYMAVVLRDATRAAAVAGAMLRAAQAYGYVGYTSTARVVGGWARVSLGDPSGLTDIEEVASDPDGHGIVGGFRDGYLQMLYADALLATGSAKDAARVCDAAIAQAGPDLRGPVAHELCLVRARALAATADPSAADAARAAVDLAEERGAVRAAADARQVLTGVGARAT